MVMANLSRRDAMKIHSYRFRMIRSGKGWECAAYAQRVPDHNVHRFELHFSAATKPSAHGRFGIALHASRCRAFWRLRLSPAPTKGGIRFSFCGARAPQAVNDSLHS